MATIGLLIVDDVAQVRQGLRTLLTLAAEEAGMELEILGEAGTGRAAVEQAEQLHPDVVLMDLAMPEMDGYAAIVAIKSGCPAIRMVAFSVHGAPEARRRARAAGADAFVEKGAPIQRLLEAICCGGAAVE